MCPGSTRCRSGRALREGVELRVYGTRTELAAGFAADGYARSSGQPGAAAALHRARRAELAHRAHGGGQRARAGGGDLQPDPVAPDRARPRLPARAARPARLVRADRQGRRAGPQRRVDPRAAGPGVADRAHPAQRPGLPRDPRRPADAPGAGRAGDDARGDGGAPVRAAGAGDCRRDAPRPRPAPGHLGRRRRPALRRHARAARAGRAASRPRWRRPTWARARSPTTTRSPPAAGCDEAALQELLSDRRRGAVRRHRARRRDDRASTGCASAARSSTSTPRPSASASTTAPCRSSATPSSTLLALVAELSHEHPEPPAADAPGARVGRARAHPRGPASPRGARSSSACSQTIEQALPPDDAITVWDMTILAYWAAPHLRLGRRPAVPVPDGLGDARLRLAGGDRRARRAPRAPGPRR